MTRIQRFPSPTRTITAVETCTNDYESKLLVGCALRDETPVDPLFVDGGRVRHLRQKQASAEDRLRPRYASNLLTDLVWVDNKTPSKTKSRKPHIAPSNTPPSSRTRLSSSNISTVSPTRTLESTRIGVSASGCSPACSHELKRRRRNTGLLWNTCTCTCIRTIARKCIMRVNIGYRPDQGMFNCTNDSCRVPEYQADLNAAANRANRLNPWGEPALEIGRR